MNTGNRSWTMPKTVADVEFIRNGVEAVLDDRRKRLIACYEEMRVLTDIHDGVDLTVWVLTLSEDEVTSCLQEIEE